MKIKSNMKLYNSHMKKKILHMKSISYVNFGNFVCEFSIYENRVVYFTYYEIIHFTYDI